ncbi:MAG: hypothetical protein IJQ39_13390 [Thermoguttaceae bacterium]|nr:hypothetical protein [Thermoguttaceae bacterium]
MKGGNGVSEASVVTLCLNRAYQIDEANNHSGSRTKSAEETSRKVREVRKVGY